MEVAPVLSERSRGRRQSRQTGRRHRCPPSPRTLARRQAAMLSDATSLDTPARCAGRLAVSHLDLRVDPTRQLHAVDLRRVRCRRMHTFCLFRSRL